MTTTGGTDLNDLAMGNPAEAAARVRAAMANGRVVEGVFQEPDDEDDADRKIADDEASAEGPPRDPSDPGPDADGIVSDYDSPEDYSEAKRIVARFCAELDQNDRDNGRRLVAWFGEGLCYVTGLGWLVWRDTHWLRDEAELDVRYLAQQVVDCIKLEALEIVATEKQRSILRMADKAQAKDEDERTEADKLLMVKAVAVRKSIEAKRGKRMNWAVTSGNAGKTSAMLEQARSLKAVPIERLDGDNMRFNVANGTLIFGRAPDPERPDDDSPRKIGTVEFVTHDRADFITKVADVRYDEKATCPFFLNEFLAKVQPDQRMQLFLQVSTAYALLVGGNDEQRLFYHYGTGANGKSAFLELIGRIAGTYRSIASPDTVTGDGQRQGQQANPDIARLHNTRLVTIEELPKNVPLREELIKALTGGTKILARFLNKDFFEFMPVFTPMLSGNSKPAISGADYGIWRRVLLVLWGVTIPPEDRMHPSLLAERLDAERPGILNWLIEGLMLYLKHGLEPYVPAEVTAFTQDYREERDNVGVFAEVGLKREEGHNEKAGPVYKAYTDWCEVNGLRAASHRSFGDRLTELGFKKRRGNYFVYLDVRLNQTASKYDGVPVPPRGPAGDPGWKPSDM